MHSCGHLVVVALALMLSVEGARIIKPSQHWLDTDGNRIEAHAAGLLMNATDGAGRIYWYGESQKTDELKQYHGGVNCYSATSLAGPWRFEGSVFTQAQIVNVGFSAPFIVERPKVVYSATTHRYVLWFHLDDRKYTQGLVGQAISSSPTGPFQFLGSYRPGGNGSHDFTLFRDHSGTVLDVRGVGGSGFAISALAADMLTTPSSPFTLIRQQYEGFALFQLPSGVYYLLASHKTGWRPNPMVMMHSTGAAWNSNWVEVASPSASNTSFNSQPTFVVEQTDRAGRPFFVYLGDNWKNCAGSTALIDACYVWLPFRLVGSSITINYQDQWDLDNPFGDL